MITEDREEVFIEATESSGLKVAAAVAALLITAIVFAGYAYLRKRQAQSAAPTQQAAIVSPKAPAQALILVDEALLQGTNTVLGGNVRNISNGKLSALSVELELKRRRSDTTERKQVPLTPADLDTSQEGRYSLQLKAQDYISAKVVALHTGSENAVVPYTLAQGDKRPQEKLETKTIKIDKSAPGKRSEFLNSPDNPARVP
ncbi:MAG: hypothetical protein QOF62_269 [Pyrinomonadaceae bacterium]|jgi:hypothetical protein|nr:hypothetical protein [Pyrinomonadaceae bacterium]